MNLIDQYMQRSHEIIGECTPEEAQYDLNVIECLKKHGKIRKALNQANKKYPKEAINYNDGNINDIESHYFYILNHMEILNR